MLCIALGYLSCSGWSRQGAAGRERTYKLSLCSQVRMGLILSSSPDLTIIPVFASQHTSRRRCRARALSCRNLSEAVRRAPAQVGAQHVSFLSMRRHPRLGSSQAQANSVPQLRRGYTRKADGRVGL